MTPYRLYPINPMAVQKVDSPPVVRRAPARREARRVTIVEGARACFQELGYNSATVEDVLKYAGISRGTFYTYFTGKSAVLIAIVESVEPQLMEIYGELGILTDLTRADVEVWLTKLLRFFATQPDVLEIWSMAVHDIDFIAFLRGLGNRMAVNMGLQPIEMTGESSRAAMFTALLLTQIGQFCSIVTLGPWGRQREQAVALMAELLHRSFIGIAREDGSFVEGPLPGAAT